MKRGLVILSEVEINHLLTLIADSEREGSYHGNREQYWKRSERIKRELEGVFTKVEGA
jgi:hypothetical protein